MVWSPTRRDTDSDRSVPVLVEKSTDGSQPPSPPPSRDTTDATDEERPCAAPAIADGVVSVIDHQHCPFPVAGITHDAEATDAVSNEGTNSGALRSDVTEFLPGGDETTTTLHAIPNTDGNSAVNVFSGSAALRGGAEEVAVAASSPLTGGNKADGGGYGNLPEIAGEAVVRVPGDDTALPGETGGRAVGDFIEETANSGPPSDYQRRAEGGEAKTTAGFSFAPASNSIVTEAGARSEVVDATPAVAMVDSEPKTIGGDALPVSGDEKFDEVGVLGKATAIRSMGEAVDLAPGEAWTPPIGERSSSGAAAAGCEVIWGEDPATSAAVASGPPEFSEPPPPLADTVSGSNREILDIRNDMPPEVPDSRLVERPPREKAAPSCSSDVESCAGADAGGVSGKVGSSSVGVVLTGEEPEEEERAGDAVESAEEAESSADLPAVRTPNSEATMFRSQNSGTPASAADRMQILSDEDQWSVSTVPSTLLRPSDAGVQSAPEKVGPTMITEARSTPTTKHYKNIRSGFGEIDGTAKIQGAGETQGSGDKQGPPDRERVPSLVKVEQARPSFSSTDGSEMPSLASPSVSVSDDWHPGAGMATIRDSGRISENSGDTLSTADAVCSEPSQQTKTKLQPTVIADTEPSIYVASEATSAVGAAGVAVAAAADDVLKAKSTAESPLHGISGSNRDQVGVNTYSSHNGHTGGHSSAVEPITRGHAVNVRDNAVKGIGYADSDAASAISDGSYARTEGKLEEVESHIPNQVGRKSQELNLISPGTTREEIIRADMKATGMPTLEPPLHRPVKYDVVGGDGEATSNVPLPAVTVSASQPESGRSGNEEAKEEIPSVTLIPAEDSRCTTQTADVAGMVTKHAGLNQEVRADESAATAAGHGGAFSIAPPQGAGEMKSVLLPSSNSLPAATTSAPPSPVPVPGATGPTTHAPLQGAFASSTDAAPVGGSDTRGSRAAEAVRDSSVPLVGSLTSVSTDPWPGHSSRPDTPGVSVQEAAALMGSGTGGGFGFTSNSSWATTATSTIADLERAQGSFSGSSPGLGGAGGGIPESTYDRTWSTHGSISSWEGGDMGRLSASISGAGAGSSRTAPSSALNSVSSAVDVFLSWSGPPADLTSAGASGDGGRGGMIADVGRTALLEDSSSCGRDGISKKGVKSGIAANSSGTGRRKGRGTGAGWGSSGHQRSNSGGGDGDAGGAAFVDAAAGASGKTEMAAEVVAREDSKVRAAATAAGAGRAGSRHDNSFKRNPSGSESGSLELSSVPSGGTAVRRDDHREKFKDGRQARKQVENIVHANDGEVGATGRPEGGQDELLDVNEARDGGLSPDFKAAGPTGKLSGVSDAAFGGDGAVGDGLGGGGHATASTATGVGNTGESASRQGSSRSGGGCCTVS